MHQQNKKKLTLTELKRYLPLSAPTQTRTFPQNIHRYLLSPSFSNYSINIQHAIKNKYDIVYRNYYSAQHIVEHIDRFTFCKYTRNSIRKAICNCAEKYGVIDWFKLVRTVMGSSAHLMVCNQQDRGSLDKSITNVDQPAPQNDSDQTIAKIIPIFRSYKQKLITWRGVEEVAETKRSIQARVLNQLIKQAYDDVLSYIQQNYVQSEKILQLYSQQNPRYTTFVQLRNLLNNNLSLSVQTKKCMYLYLHFDGLNKGFFDTSKLINQLLIIKKVKPIQQQSYYLNSVDQILQRVRTQFCNGIFYSTNDLQNQFQSYYEQQAKKIGGDVWQDYQASQSTKQYEINSEIFYGFLVDKLCGRYSKYQINQIHSKIKYSSNIHFLLNRPKPLELENLLEKLTKRQKTRKKLKKQNAIFYEFRTIILHLLTKCKQQKITHAKFCEFVAEIDPKLRYNAFYCVWKVYPGVINVQRIKQKSKLNTFACYLRLRKNEEECFMIYDQLYNMYPEQALVHYDKVEQKINLAMDFMLENSKIKASTHTRYDEVDYRKTIEEILQPEFEVMIRKYIFDIVTGKVYAMWKAKQARREAMRALQGLKIRLVASQSKKSLDGQLSNAKKLSTDRSKVSFKSRKQMSSLNQQSLPVVKWNLDKIFDDLSLKKRYLNQQFHQQQHTRKHLCLNKFENYTYRTLNCRFTMSKIVGVIGMGQDLLFLKNNKIEGIKMKFLYKPGIEVLDFANSQNDIIILTSYFTLQFFSLSQQSSYAYKTIHLLQQPFHLTNSQLENLCNAQVYSKYPIFLHSNSSNNLILINTSIVNNQIIIVNTESEKITHRIHISQRQHIFNEITETILKSIKNHKFSVEIINQIIHWLRASVENSTNQDELTETSLKNLFIKYSQMQQQLTGEFSQLRKFTTKQMKQFLKTLITRVHASQTICILKQQFNLLKHRKIPEQLNDVLHSLMQNMKMQNISLSEMLSTIDPQNKQGMVKMKSFKDYLLKITQQVYMYNEKEIDVYLKNMCIGKNVTYDTICEIMVEWPYSIWERPHLIINDFLYLSNSELLFYVVENDKNVYIKNIKDGKIIGILLGHDQTPAMLLIPSSYLLVTGDCNAIRVWRIYEDFVDKYDENPPWEINPIYVLENAHKDLITGICYLPRAHCIVTTSLDSTAKFWGVTVIQDKQSQSCSFALIEQRRLYSEQFVYISSETNLIQVSENCYFQIIALCKISKQINENNKYKLQLTIEVYQIEMLKLATTAKTLYIELPERLKQHLQHYTQCLGQKKQLLLAKDIKQQQQSIIKVELITNSLQRNLYNAVKKYYIFGQKRELEKIVNYLDKKNNSYVIYKVLFDQYGLGVISAQKTNREPQIDNVDDYEQNDDMMQTKSDLISLSQEQYNSLMEMLQGKAIGTSKQLTIEQIKLIVSEYLYGPQLDKFDRIIDTHLANKPTNNYQTFDVENGNTQSLTNQKTIKLSEIKSMFTAYKLQSEIDKLYRILRILKIRLKQHNVHIWQLFVLNKKQLQKRNKISIKQLTKKLTEMVHLQPNQIKIIISFLSKNNEISLQDLIYYMKIALQDVNLNSTNFSRIYVNNTKILETSLRKFKKQQKSGKPEESIEKKMSRLERKLSTNMAESGIRESIAARKSSSRKLMDSSSHKMSRTDKISESGSLDNRSKGRSSVDNLSQRKSSASRQKSSLQRKEVSSSHSMVSLSKESQTRDSVARVALTVIKRIKQLLRNENKTFWDIVSLTIPDFMQNEIITETEYFSVFKALKSPIYLSDKLKLLAYIQRESGSTSTHSIINLNVFFQLFQSHSLHPSSKNKSIVSTPGEKYVFNYLVNRLSENKMKLEYSISQKFYRNTNDQLSIEQIIAKVAQEPFKLLNFSLRELQAVLLLQNKSGFTMEQLRDLFQQKITQHRIKTYNSQNIGFIDEIAYLLENRNKTIYDIFDKNLCENGSVNYNIFRQLIKDIFNQKQILIQNQFTKIILKNEQISKEKDHKNHKEQLMQTPSQAKKKNVVKQMKVKNVTKMSHEQIITKCQLKYKDFIRTMLKLVEEAKKTNDNEKDTIRKFLKCLQSKKINLFTFFVSLDRNRNYYINQIQFMAGLAEFKITDCFWNSIKKKSTKKLYYNEFVMFFIEKGLVDYKCVDSQLEQAMGKFLKRYLKQDDISAVYDRIRDINNEESFNVTYQSFTDALNKGNLFTEKQIFYIFSAFVNAEDLKHSKFSNDDIIKDPSNTLKMFNFKMFTDIVNNYRNENITKTPHYRFYNWIKRRNISLPSQYIKWMQRNRKIKQIAEALKNKQQFLPKQIFTCFIKEFKTELTDRQIKQMLANFHNTVDFPTFNQKLEQVYKKGNANVSNDELINYLQKIYKRIKQLHVSVKRLFEDYTSNNFMTMNQLMKLISYLQIGLTKIETRRILESIDLQKKGGITMIEFEDALEQARESLQKQSQDYQLENIIQKLLLNKSKYQLKNSRITFTLERAILIFQGILNSDQTQILYRNTQQLTKLQQITQQNLQWYIKQKQHEIKLKKDKKYKQLIINFLQYIKRINIDVTEIYMYLTKDSQQLTKNKFLILYQSLELKVNIMEINSLYTYLDENKTGVITLQKWEDKLNMVEYEKQNVSGNISGEQVQVFYKVKLLLSQIYLILIRKMYKGRQIYAFFDVNGNGRISYQQFISSVTNGLGLSTIDVNMEQRLCNYLDRGRTAEIEISNLVNELSNCLNSKSKLILSTKTSCIFKQKMGLIQQKKDYFINRLIKLQHFIESTQLSTMANNNSTVTKLESCILLTEFTSMISDFGIVLGQDQLNDIQRNFAFNHENLFLYPLYFMFTNIFRSEEYCINYSVPEMQRKRYQQLFQAMVKHNLTMRIFSGIKTARECNNLLTQLKIFTPIECKLIIESILIPDTSLIDHRLLASKLRNSYITAGSKQLSLGLMQDSATELSQQEKLRRQLLMLIDPHEVVQILKATSGKISKSSFENLLCQLNLIFTRNQLAEYFSAMSYGEDYILIENILHYDREKQQNLQGPDNPSENQTYNRVFVILNHICKQLDFKGISLSQAWEKYYENYGYIAVEDFYSFLDEIGFQYQKEQQGIIVDNLLSWIGKEMGVKEAVKEIKTSYFQQLMKRFDQHPKLCNNTEKYVIRNAIWTELSQNIVLSSKVDNFLTQLQEHTENHTGRKDKITINTLYEFLREYYKKQCHRVIGTDQTNYLKFIAVTLLMRNQQQSMSMVSDRIRKLINIPKNAELQSQNDKIDAIQFYSNHSNNQQTNLINSHQQLDKIYALNFINAYQQQLQSFDSKIKQLSIPFSNLHRLSITLLVEQLLANPYLLIVNAQFSVLNPINKQISYSFLNLNPYTNKYLLKTVNNFIVENEEYLAGDGIYLINNQFHALNFNTQKLEFQQFATATNVLHPETIFYRAKNYYFWEPIAAKIMPKSALNYRWKYIPMFICQICRQIMKLHEHGISVPHLKWQNLSIDKGIENVPFPCKVEGHGNIENLTHRELFNPDDPYSAPQVFSINVSATAKKKAVTHKIDTWVFGCLLYEFVWGHKPISFVKQLLSYITNRAVNIDLQQVFEMQQLPSDFNYIPFDFPKITQHITMQHNLSANTQNHEQDYIANIKYLGYKGLLKNLQILYGQQHMYYKQQFTLFGNVMETIVQCLSMQPTQRPSIESILSKYEPYVKMENNSIETYHQYLSVLSRHKSCIEFNDKFVSKLDYLYRHKNDTFNIEQYNNASQDEQQLQGLLSVFETNVRQCIQGSKINQLFPIPKRYPWPSEQLLQQIQALQQQNPKDTLTNNRSELVNQSPTKSQNFNQSSFTMTQPLSASQSKMQQQQYPMNLMSNKSAIRCNIHYNIIAFVMNENCLQMLINLFMQLPDSCKERVYMRILRVCMIMMESIRDYSAALVGYVDKILEILVQLVLQRNFVFQFTSGKAHAPIVEGSRYLHVASLNNIEKNKSLSFLSKIIYLDGTANLEYRPIKQFMDTNPHYKLLYEYFYCSIKLDSPILENRILAINYFRDRIYQQYFWLVQNYLKVDLLVLKSIYERQIIDEVLEFYYELSQHEHSHCIELFHHSVFYLLIGASLRDELENHTRKSLVIKIVTNLIKDSENLEIFRVMNEPSCSIIREVMRLLIEPVRETPLHEDYRMMQSELLNFVNKIWNSQAYMMELRETEAAEFVLESFRNQHMR